MKKLTTLMVVATLACMPIGVSFGLNYGEYISTASILANTLPSDGCQHTVITQGVEYSLESSTYSDIAGAFAKRTDGGGTIRQRVIYMPTGKTNYVTCGRGNKVLPEMRIISYLPNYRFSYATLLPDLSDANGCEHTVKIGTRTFSLDTDSYNIVAGHFANVYNPDVSLYKRISYHISGISNTVQCSNNTVMSLPEISIQVIY